MRFSQRGRKLPVGVRYPLRPVETRQECIKEPFLYTFIVWDEMSIFATILAASACVAMDTENNMAANRQGNRVHI